MFPSPPPTQFWIQEYVGSLDPESCGRFVGAFPQMMQFRIVPVQLDKPPLQPRLKAMVLFTIVPSQFDSPPPAPSLELPMMRLFSMEPLHLFNPPAP
jgi:hypothetical protein